MLSATMLWRGTNTGLSEQDWQMVANRGETPAGTIPAGMLWYIPMKVLADEGHPVELFPTIKQSEFTDQDDVHVSVNADPAVQFVPESGVATLRVLSAAAEVAVEVAVEKEIA